MVPAAQRGGIGVSECQNCGAFVTDEFARVFGSNDGAVHGCLDCMDATKVRNGVPAQPQGGTK